MRLCPWADVVYGCDGPWWKNKNGLPGYAGTKLCHDTEICTAYRDIHKIEIKEKQHEILLDEPGRVGSGGNSGFQALNIAAQFGARRVLLIGYDMHTGNGVHWYGHNIGKGMRNPGDVAMRNWRKAFAANAKLLRSFGIEVINASADSALDCFEKRSVDDTLKAWGI